MAMNKVLTDQDRLWLTPVINRMYKEVPEMTNRKIASALVQQAFVANTIMHALTSKGIVLNAGAYEDTAGELLRVDGYNVVDVDPAINYDLHTFRLQGPGLFDAVISTSVLEHTTNDEEFLEDCCSLLVPCGIGVFTMDFKDDWMPGERVPSTSNRFYRRVDLEQRLPAVLVRCRCKLVGEPDYSAVDTFSWEGIPYSFATFVFQKDDELGTMGEIL